MKTDIISLVVVAAAAFAGMTSCSDTWTNDLAEEEKGTLNTNSILASVNTYEDQKEDAQGAKAPESRAVTDLSPFIVEVVKPDGSKVASWTYTTMPPAPTFAVGTYTVRVKSHNPPARRMGETLLRRRTAVPDQGQRCDRRRPHRLHSGQRTRLD